MAGARAGRGDRRHELTSLRYNLMTTRRPGAWPAHEPAVGLLNSFRMMRLPDPPPPSAVEGRAVR